MFSLLTNIPSYLNLTTELGKHSEDDYSFENGNIYFHEDNRIHYLHRGKGKETIIFLHGIMVNANIWKRYIDHFSEKYTVYAPDFLGHGLSAKKEDLHIEDLVGQIRDFIIKNKIKNPILVGHSLGGLVASIYASLYPDSVSRTILISSGEYDSITNNFIARINSQFIDLTFSLMNSFTFPLFLQFLSERVYNKSINIMDDSWSDILYAFKIKGSKQSLLSLMKNTEIKNFSPEDYKHITCPVFLLHGAKDKLVESWHSENLSKLIPQSTVKIIPGGSHMVIEEQEDLVKGYIEEFIEKTQLIEKS